METGDETPTRATTRLPEPGPADEPGLLPPFVPGRSAGGARPESAPPATVDDFPFETPTEPAEPAIAPASPAAQAGAGSDARDEVANLLERLAARVRDEGAAGARSLLEEADALTAALAGVVAGYLARQGE